MIDLTNNQKIRYGEEALLSYQNAMVARFGEKYSLSYDSLRRLVIGREPDFLLDLGNAVGMAGIGQRRLNEAMERVVMKSTSDEIPKSWTFGSAVAEELEDFDFSVFGDSAIAIAKDTVEKGQEIGKDLGEAVTGVTKSISFVGKNLVPIAGALLLILAGIGFVWASKKAE